MKLLSPADVARIGQLALAVETTHFPAAYYCTEQIQDCRAIAAELRRIVGLPPASPWPELAANAEPLPKEENRG